MVHAVAVLSSLSILIGGLTGFSPMPAACATWLSSISRSLLGAQVTVGRATLSIFERIGASTTSRVYCEPPSKGEPKSIRALPIFAASRFQITYKPSVDDPRAIGGGRRIVRHQPAGADRRGPGRRALELPEAVGPQSAGNSRDRTEPAAPVCRNWYLRRRPRIDSISKSATGVKSAVGSMSIEGEPVRRERAVLQSFNLQSRGLTQETRAQRERDRSRLPPARSRGAPEQLHLRAGHQNDAPVAGAYVVGTA